MAETCPKCGGVAVKAGTRVYVSGKYQMRRCTKCGHEFKAEKIEMKE